MAIVFPDNPYTGRHFRGWQWDGVKWLRTSLEAIVAGFEAGTVALFYQPTTPVGWTRLTTLNDRCLRVVASDGGAIGGASPFSTIMAQTVTGGRTLSLDQIPAGIACEQDIAYSFLPSATGTWTVQIHGGGNAWIAAAAQTGGWPAIHNSGGTGSWQQIFTSNVTTFNFDSNNTSGQAHTHPLILDIAYVDLIAASRDE